MAESQKRLAIGFGEASHVEWGPSAVIKGVSVSAAGKPGRIFTAGTYHYNGRDYPLMVTLGPKGVIKNAHLLNTGSTCVDAFWVDLDTDPQGRPIAGGQCGRSQPEERP